MNFGVSKRVMDFGVSKRVMNFGVSKRVMIIAMTLLAFIFILTLTPKEALVNVSMIALHVSYQVELTDLWLFACPIEDQVPPQHRTI
jgi:hypothetical protein